MNRLLRSKRVWISALVFLMFAGVAYADYTMPDGSVVKWAGGNNLEIINPDGSSHTTTGVDNGNGRLVPVDHSVDNNVASQLPSFNDSSKDGMDNTGMTVPIIEDGHLAGWGDVYGDGHTYQGDTSVRGNNESQGNTVDWNPSNNGYGGGVIDISSGHSQDTTPTPSNPPSGTSSNDPGNHNNGNSGGSSNNGGGSSSGGGNSGGYHPPAPHVISITINGPKSATAAQSYSYTATAHYSNGVSREVTESTAWQNGPTFTPQNQGNYTVSASFNGVTGTKQVNVVLPPVASPPAKPPVRLY